jgi:hypothetical protein
MSPLALRPLWLGGGACLVALVLAFALAPASAVPATGLGDRFEHTLAFVTLTLWFAGLLQPALYAPLGLALLAFGASIEWLQRASALGRVADLHDLAADLVGVVVGLAAARAGLGRWMQWVEARLIRR